MRMQAVLHILPLDAERLGEAYARQDANASPRLWRCLTDEAPVLAALRLRSCALHPCRHVPDAGFFYTTVARPAHSPPLPCSQGTTNQRLLPAADDS